MSAITKITIGIGLVFIIGIIIVLYQFSAPQIGAKEETLVVSLGTTEKELIHKLKEEGFIRNERAFEFVLTIKGWRGKIRPGGYLVSKGLNAWQLADILVNHPYQKWVIIPEGLRKEEIADIVQNKLAWSDDEKKEFLENAREGYLFPDTYLFNLDFSGKEVAQRMTNNFNEKVAPLFIKAKENNIRNDTLIVLASLLQREAASEKEMPLIAGIIWNRWLKNMRLEIDATVQYALGREGNWWPKISSKDYRVNSPYNTYLHKGRPPTPICNPGLAAIEAVIYPKETEYFYYLHDSKGQIHLAKTYKEHLENINKYLKSSLKE